MQAALPSLDRPLTAHAHRNALLRRATCAASAALILLVGCAEAPSGPVAVSPDGGAWSVMIVKIDEQLTARAVDRGVDGIEVLLQRSDGQSVFESTAQAIAGNHVRWSETYHLGLEQRTGELALKSSLLLPDEPRESVTLEGAVWTAAFVHAQLSAAARGDKSVGDHSGCDIPGIGDDVSCSNKGACCDAHDECYRENHCTRGSFREEHDSSCQTLCNDAVKRCLLRSESTPGKSVCCASGTCGADSTSQGRADAGIVSVRGDGGAGRDGGASNDAGTSRDAGERRDAGATRDAGQRPDAGAVRDAGAGLDAGVTPGVTGGTSVPGVSTGSVSPSSSVNPSADPASYPATNPSLGSGVVSWPATQGVDSEVLDPERYPVDDDGLEGEDEYDDDDDDSEVSDDESYEAEDESL